jgi:hypothetical protein
VANPVLDKFFPGRFGSPGMGAPSPGPGGSAPVGINSVMPNAGGAGGEPPWVTKARAARKQAKLGAQPQPQPPVSTTEAMPPELAGSRGMPAPGAGEIVDPWAGGSGNIPAPTGPYNPGPQPAPSGAPPPLMGGIPRGGIMGGQGIPKMPQRPPLQRNPQGPPPLPAPPKAPKASSDSGAVFGKVPGGGF